MDGSPTALAHASDPSDGVPVAILNLCSEAVLRGHRGQRGGILPPVGPSLLVKVVFCRVVQQVVGRALLSLGCFDRCFPAVRRAA